MKRSTKIITAVALSIGLIGGAAAIGKNRHNPEQRADRMVQRITTELALDATQSQALDVLRTQWLAAHQTVNGGEKPLRKQILSMMTEETFDRAQALEMIVARTAAINEQAPDMVNATGDFLDTLSTEQKTQFSELMKKHRGRHKRRNSQNQ